MTKENLQKELKEKVKEGVKPSKIKKSRSAEPIGLTPPVPPLQRSKSNEPFTDPKYPYTTLISQQEELDKLKKETQAKSDTIALLRKKIGELEKIPPRPLLVDQLKEKQQEIEALRKQGEDSAQQIENLREQLAQKSTELSTLKQEQSALLDTNLTLKHQALKDWWTQYQQTQKLEQELKENVDYASEELISQDKRISSLSSQLFKLKQTNQSLAKDLALTTKLAELRKNPLPSNSTNSPWTLYVFTFGLIGITLWLTKTTHG